jgi:hypothetical protein
MERGAMQRPSERAGDARPDPREAARAREVPSEAPGERDELPGARRDDEVVEVAVEDSFPASDPPAYTSSAIGAPVRRPPGARCAPEVAPHAEPDVPATESEAREQLERDPERAGSAGREGREPAS